LGSDDFSQYEELCTDFIRRGVSAFKTNKADATPQDLCTDNQAMINWLNSLANNDIESGAIRLNQTISESASSESECAASFRKLVLFLACVAYMVLSLHPWFYRVYYFNRGRRYL
jgi:hypothetical protein